jgi:hypothetical protein
MPFCLMCGAATLFPPCGNCGVFSAKRRSLAQRSDQIIGGKLNGLRFSEGIWESALMANSRFYTNRLRYSELLRLFREAGFEPEVVRKTQWETLPTPRRKMAKEFALLPEEDLRISDFDVLLY